MARGMSQKKKNELFVKAVHDLNLAGLLAVLNKGFAIDDAIMLIEMTVDDTDFYTESQRRAAFRDSAMELFRALLNKKPVNPQHLLMAAVDLEDVELAKSALKAGAKLDHRDERPIQFRFTPLMWAFAYQREKAVKWLLELGATPTIVDPVKQSYHLATDEDEASVRMFAMIQKKALDRTATKKVAAKRKAAPKKK